MTISVLPTGCSRPPPACPTSAHITTTSTLCRAWPHSLGPAVPVVARSGQRCCCLLRQQLPPLLLPPFLLHPGVPRLVPSQDVRARLPSCLWAGKVGRPSRVWNNVTAWIKASLWVSVVLTRLSWASLGSVGGRKVIISRCAMSHGAFGSLRHAQS